ncbi:hypothetical protein O3P69_018713 [Scylla paramamosain]|uniref:Uncharacterized protein n=1 Tax=Scylla paramamosain TaxID=85552 RepID=A0AAW0SSI8_SCYPA
MIRDVYNYFLSPKQTAAFKDFQEFANSRPATLCFFSTQHGAVIAVFLRPRWPLPRRPRFPAASGRRREGAGFLAQAQTFLLSQQGAIEALRRDVAAMGTPRRKVFITAGLDKCDLDMSAADFRTWRRSLEDWIELNAVGDGDAARYIRLLCAPELQKALDARYPAAKAAPDEVDEDQDVAIAAAMSAAAVAALDLSGCTAIDEEMVLQVALEDPTYHQSRPPHRESRNHSRQKHFHLHRLDSRGTGVNRGGWRTT